MHFPLFLPMPITEQKLAEKLREYTSRQHQEAEEVLLSFLKRIRNREDYKRILLSFYAFFHPLQQKICEHIGIEDLSDIHDRRSASLILRDLETLDPHSNEELLFTDFPLITSKARAFGALYVLEGSTLGGRMIAKMLLSDTESFINENQLHFFNGYGSDTSRKWKSFQEVLNRQEDEDEVIEAARETFTLFKNCLIHFLSDGIQSK